ncbi:protein of unknown function [Candidatus Filomicrobium marinum]|uniref:Uncharacterized protein n=1 Tax=Candidatus Filomicrobium marinum TaxID=1608628 RepID=A0A0D6JF28_9HYPH|nr:protein of unknown function [Candidatus Filomicrobium marinum]
MPKLIERFTDVPERDRHVYQLGADGYELTAGGSQLRKLRQALSDHRVLESIPPQIWGKEPSEISLADWHKTLTTATAPERKELLKLVAAGKLSIKR